MAPTPSVTATWRRRTGWGSTGLAVPPAATLPSLPPSSLPWNQVPKVRTEKQREQAPQGRSQALDRGSRFRPGAWGRSAQLTAKASILGTKQVPLRWPGVARTARGRVAVPGHRDELRLCPPPPESGDKATAFPALESMNGGGGGLPQATTPGASRPTLPDGSGSPLRRPCQSNTPTRVVHPACEQFKSSR